MKEPIQLGQRIKKFIVQLKKDGNVIKEIVGTTIGKKCILTFESTEANGFDIIFIDAKTKPVLSEASAYLIDEGLIEKE